MRVLHKGIDGTFTEQPTSPGKYTFCIQLRFDPDVGFTSKAPFEHLFHPLTFLWMNCEFLIYEFVSVWWWGTIPETFFNLCEFPQSTAFCTNSIIVFSNTIQQTLEEFVLGVVKVKPSILRVEDNIVSL